jgi:hypothetical protein
MHTKFWLADLGVDVKMILEVIMGKEFEKLWAGCMWLRIGTSGNAIVKAVMNLQVIS